jgi:hypothetical protein
MSNDSKNPTASFRTILHQGACPTQNFSTASFRTILHQGACPTQNFSTICQLLPSAHVCRIMLLPCTLLPFSPKESTVDQREKFARHKHQPTSNQWLPPENKNWKTRECSRQWPALKWRSHPGLKGIFSSGHAEEVATVVWMCLLQNLCWNLTPIVVVLGGRTFRGKN